MDIALWNLAGKALKQPIYKLLGAYRDKMRVYASSWRLPSPQDYADEGGHKAYKLLLLRMEKANAAAVAKLTYREREHLAIIRPYDGGAFAPDPALR